MSLTIIVRGMPGAQGSKRLVAHGVMVEQSKKVAPWRTDVKAAAEAAIAATDWETATVPVRVYVVFRFVRPRSHYRTGANSHLLRDGAPRYPIGRNLGDIDKLCRSTLDALTAAGVFADDSLVWEIHAMKQWSNVPGAFIEISAPQ